MSNPPNRRWPRVPADLARSAVALARAGGYPLTDYLHFAIALAGQAAEAGRADLLPAGGVRRRRDGAETLKVPYSAPDDEWSRYEVAFRMADTSVSAVAEEALTAYVAAGGNLVDVRLRWLPSLAVRGRRAA